jgi:hypothetical protein
MAKHIRKPHCVSDAKYIKSKLDHMQRLGIKCGLNPSTGAARPDWAKEETEARNKRHVSRRA